MKRYRIAALGLAALFLYACASTQAPKPVAGAPAAAPAGHGIARVDPRPTAAGAVVTNPAQPGPAPRGSETADSLSAALYSRPGDLPGWLREDHVAALTAYQEGCALAHEVAAQETCNAARLLGQADEDTARRFLEASFRVETLGGPGLLTAYFSPQYEAREIPGGEFIAAVQPAPADLKQGQTYADRTTIEDRPPNGALAWMRPEDLFFLQIQGSGTLVYPDGHKMKAVFAAHNSRTFVGIANPMRERGLLPANNTSGDAIRHWLADNRGQKAAEIMRLNPRYVFFRLEADDGVEPIGAAALPLPAGHAIAVDPGFHTYGEAIWIDASAPTLSGAFPVYQRLVMALDTGGAIKGEVRADLYLGRGDDAGREAGRVRHDLRMYRLVPLGRQRG